MTDNASNMKVAFAVSFPTSEQDAEVLEPPENEDLWNECKDTSAGLALAGAEGRNAPVIFAPTQNIFLTYSGFVFL